MGVIGQLGTSGSGDHRRWGCRLRRCGRLDHIAHSHVVDHDERGAHAVDHLASRLCSRRISSTRLLASALTALAVAHHGHAVNDELLVGGVELICGSETSRSVEASKRHRLQAHE